MHWQSLPPVCLLLSLFSSPLSLAANTQASFRGPVNAQGTTLVDALGADPDYTSVLRLLQRARLIPTLNRLDGATLFAPTNDAIKKHLTSEPSWSAALDDDRPLNDNVHEELRQQLFYHLLNYTLPELPTDTHPTVQLTLLFPQQPQPPSREPPPLPPWLPEPGGTLGGEPQRLRLASRNDNNWVGVDAFGRGGVRIVKERVEAGNGVLYGIGGVLVPPPDLASIVKKQKQLTYLSKIATSDIDSLLNSTEALTLFLPVDAAWGELEPYERLYLESEFAVADLNRIFNMHAVVENGVKWSDQLKDNSKFKSIEGLELSVSATSDGQIKISDADLLRPDIYASNGVIHLVSSLLTPPGTFRLTPEKYLLALKCTRFVSLLHSVNLTHLINDPDAKDTILALPDNVLSIFATDDEFPEPGSPELKKLLEYHFIPGKWSPKKLETGMLLETALKEEGLDGGRQVLNVEVVSEDKKNPPEKSIKFGGAGIIGDPIEVEGTLVYFLSRPMVPPSDPSDVALPVLDWSSFLAAVFSTYQDEIFRRTPHVSLFIPRNAGFKRLGLLVSNHLLSPTSKPDLEKVLLHHAIDTVQYANALQSGSQHTFRTLEKTDLQIERLTNGTIYASPSGGWDKMKSLVSPRNLLTRTGVVHELSDVLIPRSVHLTIGKLMKAAKGGIMASMVNKAGLDFILDGSNPPKGSPWADEDLNGASWTLLCPPDDAFKAFNLTELYEDTELLKAIVMQHLIITRAKPKDETSPSSFLAPNDPLNNNRPISLDPSIIYNTLRSPLSSYGDVVFRRLEDGVESFVVGIKGARGTNGQADWARVLAWGRTTSGGGTGGVIQIDGLLLPYQPPWWVEFGGPAVVGVLGILGICGFFYGVRRIWLLDTTEATYEPIGGFDREDHDNDG